MVWLTADRVDVEPGCLLGLQNLEVCLMTWYGKLGLAVDCSTARSLRLDRFRRPRIGNLGSGHRDANRKDLGSASGL